MPVELRKRKAPPPPPEPPAKKKATKATPKAKETVKTAVKEAVKAKPEKADAPAKANGASSKKVAVGDIVDLTAFGGEVTLNDGSTTTLASLVEESGAGVVLFTYPKASTPGCTNQACLFRDSYEPLTAGGLAIYGLSRDSPKANTTFKEKQKLPYPLLCDPSASLIGAIGLKKAPSGTQRGVFVVDKKGKVLLAEPGSPAGTVQAVKKLVESGAVNGEEKNGEKEEKADEEDVKANGDEAEDAKEEKEDAKKEEEEEKKEEKKEEKEEEEEEEKKKEDAEKEDEKKDEE